MEAHIPEPDPAADIGTVALLGVGTLGSIFADRLLDVGVSLTLFDVDDRRVAPFMERGVRVASGATDLVHDADIVLVSLPDPAATVRAVLGRWGVIAACHPGALIVDTSTIDPVTARDVAREAARRTVDYLEAPLSGGDEEGSGVDAARAGAATFICGGLASAIERARPLLQVLGRHVLHVGPAGSGATAKLVSNHLAGLHNLIAAEALAIGRAAGLSLETMLSVFRHTDAQSYWLFNYLAPRLARGDFDDGFSIDLQHKDHRLLGELAARHGAATPLNNLALELYQAMRASGLGRKDLTEAANVACERAGLTRFDG
ncbi:MAG: NAD(P)-dependent oxidoreductase [Actinomycetota bacterium]|nr:NAD(P)-dependent oxidoreductase [Actinomycetota bacterium]